MNIDIHNHTKLCNHAEGEIEDFVIKAISEKVDIFGFSDHAPMNFDQKYRMSFNQMKEYENSILHVKEKYIKDIEILLGYEVDFLENLVDERVINANVDFLIGSVHFLKKWGFDNPEFIGEYKNKDIDTIWEEYFEAIRQMAKSGLFDIIGHIDLIKVFKYLPKKDIRIIAKESIKAIKKADMVVEINSAGLRKPVKEIYPGNEIMELISEYDISVTFSSDAHRMEEINYKKDETVALAKKFGYTKCAIFREREKIMVNF